MPASTRSARRPGHMGRGRRAVRLRRHRGVQPTGARRLGLGELNRPGSVGRGIFRDDARPTPSRAGTRGCGPPPAASRARTAGRAGPPGQGRARAAVARGVPDGGLGGLWPARLYRGRSAHAPEPLRPARAFQRRCPGHPAMRALRRPLFRQAGPLAAGDLDQQAAEPAEPDEPKPAPRQPRRHAPTSRSSGISTVRTR